MKDQEMFSFACFEASVIEHSSTKIMAIYSLSKLSSNDRHNEKFYHEHYECTYAKFCKFYKSEMIALSQHFTVNNLYFTFMICYETTFFMKCIIVPKFSDC